MTEERYYGEWQRGMYVCYNSASSKEIGTVVRFEQQERSVLEFLD